MVTADCELRMIELGSVDFMRQGSVIEKISLKSTISKLKDAILYNPESLKDFGIASGKKLSKKTKIETAEDYFKLLSPVSDVSLFNLRSVQAQLSIISGKVDKNLEQILTAKNFQQAQT